MKVSISSWKFPSVLVLAAIGSAVPVGAQSSEPFIGTLSFEVTSDRVKTPMRYYSDGEHLRVELGTLGDPYLIWLTGLEDIEGAALLSSFNKSYTIEPDGPMRPRDPQDDRPNKKPSLEEMEIPEGVPAELMGVACLQYHLMTDGPDTDVWILENALPFPPGVLRMWTNLGEAVPIVARICREHAGIPIKAERNIRKKKNSFSLQLQRVATDTPSMELFTIPEGYYRAGSASPKGRKGSEGKGGKRPSEGGRGRPREGRPR